MPLDFLKKTNFIILNLYGLLKSQKISKSLHEILSKTKEKRVFMPN